MRGLVADANLQGQVEYLVQRMQADPWADFWRELGLVLCRFEDVGLSTSSADSEVWSVCRAQQLILITDNRNLDSEDSLEATIRRRNTPEFLPVFTIADMNQFRTNNPYVERVVETLYDFLVRIDDVRGIGRLYLLRRSMQSKGSPLVLVVRPAHRVRQRIPAFRWPGWFLACRRTPPRRRWGPSLVCLGQLA